MLVFKEIKGSENCVRKWDKKEIEQVNKSTAWFAIEGRLDKDALLGTEISWTNMSM